MNPIDQRPGPHRPYYHIAEDGLRVLLDIFGFSQHASVQQRDVVLVSIDFENTHHFKGHLHQDVDTQVGLAILDTRHLSSTAPDRIISTHNLVTGSSKYFRRAMLKYLFGKPALINTRDIVHQLHSLIPRGREIVLVGHDIRFEYHILRKLGFDRQPECCLDTYRMAGQVLPYWSLRLGELLTELGCPYDWLHNGGNDANYTLKALLLLATRAVRSNMPDEWTDKVELLETIAMSPIPTVSPGEEELIAGQKAVAAEKRAASRVELKLSNIGRQAEIRDQRAIKKLFKELPWV
ncbi:hypothetical protein PG993_000030 [Apiospora rasikravindrae]|uniref:Gfd2/YDR514C-like C-terminal domain-containing protein n=1 Tax=Apiospora rasikravindrae TaxID=990691 RepID=A0ABR1U7E8_9PEZI